MQEERPNHLSTTPACQFEDPLPGGCDHIRFDLKDRARRLPDINSQAISTPRLLLLIVGFSTMPTYLCHGFRWQRRSIRVYVILQNLDDASPEWIIPARSSRCILGSFYNIFDFLPYCSPKRGRYVPAARDFESDEDTRGIKYTNGVSEARSRSQHSGRSYSHGTAQSRSQSRAKEHEPLPSLPIDDESSGGNSSSSSSADDFLAQSWSAVKLLEEYDPRDLTAVSRPYAYVADYAVRIDLSCSIIEEVTRYEQQQLASVHPAVSRLSKNPQTGQSTKPGWLEELRDQLQRDGEIGWYVVVNGDEVRDWPDEFAEESASATKATAGDGSGHQYPQYRQYQQQQAQKQQ
ncbi:hypothetical protein N0V88_003082 [Collariella sp. IMI 366227]|nr:hypothetical protein N0V88_003082 [Collariella sp. IMI 366227]